MSELNKILGRDFIIAFLLPALFLLVASFFLLKAAGLESSWLRFDLQEPLKDSTILALDAFVLGVFLQSVNRELFRLTEGYWWNTILTKLTVFQKKRFRELNQEIRVLKEKKEECQLQNTTFEEQLKYNRLSEEAATKYPRREDLVLPTTFGNVVRAYEDYPRAVYGFESITGWSRMQGLISKQMSEVLSRTRSRVDMWLNFAFVAGLLMVEILLLTWKVETRSLIRLLPFALIFMLFAYTRARSSAIRYGEQVKAVFDIYLPQLAQKLGFVLGRDAAKNRKFWQAYSRLMVYRDAKAAEEMLAVGLKRASVGKSEPGDESSEEDDG
jgi:hypothetical protein